MSTMDDRQKAFENKFKLDEETKFKIGARRAKLAGLWVAEKLGLNGKDAEEYAKLMVTVDLSLPGDADILQKIKGDFDNRGIVVSDREIAQMLEEKAEVAKQQLMAGQ